MSAMSNQYKSDIAHAHAAVLPHQTPNLYDEPLHGMNI
jgi:hypothetical protein